ncbi:hypothetical protein R3P38DRAFT_3120346 [Favolaschia claudopus]|uniref:Uncharacterized protein n=1 Tax=Favolaschia claudopus TaxID=2862362 RepID=A0AAV9ZCU2_9AGAR
MAPPSVIEKFTIDVPTVLPANMARFNGPRKYFLRITVELFLFDTKDPAFRPRLYHAQQIRLFIEFAVACVKKGSPPRLMPTGYNDLTVWLNEYENVGFYFPLIDPADNSIIWKDFYNLPTLKGFCVEDHELSRFRVALPGQIVVSREEYDDGRRALDSEKFNRMKGYKRRLAENAEKERGVGPDDDEYTVSAEDLEVFKHRQTDDSLASETQKKLATGDHTPIPVTVRPTTFFGNGAGPSNLGGSGGAGGSGGGNANDINMSGGGA